MAFNPNAFEILKERGFVQITSHEAELRAAMKKGPVTFYLGIDPTADDLHIGHFFALMVFKILQDCGHKGILLLGGATTQVGDPSGKDDIRRRMPVEQINQNAKLLKNVLSRFIDVERTTFVNNADWFRGYDYIDVLDDIGGHFTIAEMLTKECYKNRLGSGLTIKEMGYLLIQSWDFVHLHDTYGCTLQIGGTDQWTNILGGVDLARKLGRKQQLFALANPLLTKSDGQKMGKTEKGVLWVTESKTSVYDFYQYFVNADDKDVERLLTYFTMLPITQIKDMCKKDIIEAKKFMALEVTARIHGNEAALKAQMTSALLFGGEQSGDNAPTETIKTTEKNIVEILALTSIIQSKREARELIASGAIHIDGEKVTDTAATIDKKTFILKKGKKTFLKIVIKQ